MRKGSGRLVRVLLRLYPREFRERFGREMEDAYRAQASARRRADGRGGLLRLWVRTATGMVAGAAAEWTTTTRTGGGTMDRWTQEIGQAVRRLARAPAFTALTVATLGLGVGAFTAVWAVVDSVLLEPMPYDDPEELAWVWRDYAWLDLPRGWLGGPDLAWMQESEVFEAVSALRTESQALTVPWGDEPREVRTLLTSAGFFDLLGVEPAIGRGFAPGEDGPGAPAVAVLDHDFWLRAFGGDPALVGREIVLDGETTRVVGILPERFDFVTPTSLGSPVGAEVYVPVRMALAELDPYNGMFAGVVRTAEGVTPAAVEGTLARIADRVDEGWSTDELRLWASPMQEELVAEVRPALLAIAGAAGFLLLVLAANLATLLLARTAARERETAVRAALGAGRASVAGIVLAEALLLALAGGVVAILVGGRGADLLAGFAADSLPRAAAIHLDGSGILLALAVTGLLAVLSAAGPVARALRMRTGPALREGGARSGASVRQVRARSGLVVAQVALSVVLLVGAGLLARSLAGLLAADPGFEPGETLTFRLSLEGASYPDDAAVLSFTDLLLDRLEALPGVDAVAVADALPLTAGASQSNLPFVDAPGLRSAEEGDEPFVDRFRVSAGYFEAVGLRLVEGRAFHAHEWGDDGRAVVIDDVLARRTHPGGSGLGARVVLGPDTATVVGVVDQARLYDVHRDDRPQVYIPWSWNPAGAVTVAMRTRRDPRALLEPARAVVHGLDGGVPVSDVRTLDGIAAAALDDDRLNLTLVGTFALAALLLASLGIYGVVAHAVVRRRPEIGVRLALGAEAGGIVRMVVSQGLRLVLAGAVLGVVGAAFAARLLASLLYGVEPMDLPTYAGVVLLLVGIATLAAWIPALRAARVQPSEALRAG